LERSEEVSVTRVIRFTNGFREGYGGLVKGKVSRAGVRHSFIHSDKQIC